MRTVTMSKMGANPTVRTSARVLNIALWILQVLMAALFFWHDTKRRWGPFGNR